MSLPIWYEKGVKFKCTQCGKCCSGSPGYVWLTEKDIEMLCNHLKMDRATFLKKYTRLVNNRLSLTEIGSHYDCVFFKNKQCTVYGARPKQCRQFPFWKSIMKSEMAWDDTKDYCEGINHPEGKFYTKEDIEQSMR